MPFFNSSAPADPILLGALRLSPSERYWNKIAEKAVAKESDFILATLRSYQSSPLLLTHSFNAGDVGVVTPSEVFTVKKGRVVKSLNYAEVAETEIRALSNQGNNLGMMVVIESKKSRSDFHPNDVMRFGHIITLQVPTPGIANEICSIIDSRIG